jgi:predicted RNA-binding protein with PIN domain
MRKWLIIDGYNLLYKLLPNPEAKNRSLEEQRENLIKDVAELGYLMAEKLTIVFDGRSSIKRERIEQKTIEIIFASPELTADTIIIHLLKKYQNPQEVAVVSSDRIVVENAGSLGAEAMSATFFLEWLASARQNLTARLDRQSTRRVSFTLGDIFPATKQKK